jgi:pimeloyl-ACP methyl ester carboxylesterase
VVAVDLRGYGGSDKPPRGYDGWTLAGDTAGLVRALGHKSATLVGHADGGLVCWATSVLHPRMVRAIAVVSSPHPVALRASALTRRDQGLALLPWMLRYPVADPQRRRGTRATGAKPRQWQMASLRRLFRDHSAHAEGHPDSVGGALGS